MKFEQSRTAKLGVATLIASALAVSTPTVSHALVAAEVTNVNDSGAGSLRRAIQDANDPALTVDEVIFNIPGAGRQVITPLTDLPDITAPVTIDGYTQPGAAPATNQDDADPLIVLDAALMSEGLQISTNDATVRGLVIRDAVNGVSGGGDGISVDGDNNTIVGNYIGLSVGGDKPAGNEGSGVDVEGDGNVIGGSTPADRNLISDNSEDGVIIEGDTNTVLGNYIGTDDSGADGFGNVGNGVHVAVGVGNVIGGTSAAAGNVISDNTQDGVRVNSSGTGTAVRHNLVGVSASGLQALGNTGSGVEVEGDDTVLVRNVISGNGWAGVEGGANDVRLFQNTIGLDAAGTAALGNVSHGIDLIGEGVVVGGPQQGNIVSGNLGDGVQLNGADGAVVQGNLVGTDASGLLPLGNGSQGILVTGSDVLIGGTAVGAGNTVAANGSVGINTSSDNGQVRNNTVGGAVGMGNAGAGIQTSDGPSLTKGNKVADNGQGGIAVVGTDEQRLSRNEIGSNVGLGIDLDGNGVVEVNDAGDVDNGANDLLNFPVVNTATAVGGNASVTWQFVNALPATAFTLEFFASAACNPGAPFGEGERFLGSLPGNTTGAGNASGNGVLAPVSVGEFVTATATEVATGSTSEFSACVQVM